MKDVAEEMLKRDPELLIARNDLGETPIFCAARYGQTEMFKFLAGEMKLTERNPEDGKQYLQRNDRTTVLHISIFTECFDLAHFIAESYSYLIEERDQDSMTALQYLACNPIAFEKKKIKTRRGFMEELMISTRPPQGLMEKLINSKWPSKDNSKTSDERCYSLQGLVKLLVKNDTSWHASVNSQEVGSSEIKELDIEKEEKISQEKKGQNFQENEGQNYQESSTNYKYKKSDETPLFLATISNIQDIVEEILVCHPQALEHINKEGMNILHVAILYRHIEIFDIVSKSELLARSLLSATDNKGNSLLHMVGLKRKSQASEKMQIPASQLQEELLLFKKVKSACKMHLTKPLNKDNQTAEELFAARNERLHRDAKGWLMRTTENCTILSIFIATVAFAAAYTVPGGPNQNTGIPILNSKPLFVVFILADVFSLSLALTSVGKFLSILTSSFPLQDFETYLFKKLTQGIICMILSVSMMAVAFGATIILIMTHNWTNAVWSVVGFLPVPIFFLSYSPLRSAVLGRCTESSKYFVAKFLKGVAIGVVIFIFVPLYCLYLAFKGLFWTVKKAFRWICGNKSDTQSPQPTAAPITQV
ncbi:uncharacterized protein LOC117911615 isoform X1 [Vitis riparia]|uniref:uncharacterized protein LOC117911615 isoform X1 n=1 Tax=Vitis riparia TaxID=96939 RepID=UPI00155B2C42|nr:uncharacterized protein LOC117911615 isoform X1 [Vitis riparia]